MAERSKVTPTNPREIAGALSPKAREVVLLAVDGDPGWLEPGSDPGPMLEARRAGCVRSDVFAVTPTPLGRRVAKVLRAQESST